VLPIAGPNMSTISNSSSGQRARRALTHGRGIDGLMLTGFMLGGVALLIGLLVYSFQSAETRAERDTGNDNPAVTAQTELGRE